MVEGHHVVICIAYIILAATAFRKGDSWEEGNPSVSPPTSYQKTRNPSFELKDDSKFDWKLANVSVLLAAESYCSPETYLLKRYDDSAIFPPLLHDFKPTYRIRAFDDASSSETDPNGNTDKIMRDMNLKNIIDHDTNGFVGTMDEDIYIVFRGSQSLSNFIDDFDIRTIEKYCDGCFVHKGFYESSQEVFYDTAQEILRLYKENSSLKNVVVTGHSLGAALATLMALNLSQEGILEDTNLDVKLINFGSPRLANTRLAEYISAKIPTKYRITNHKDIVPHLPLFALGFDHIDGEFYQDEDGIHECTGFADPACSSQWSQYTSVPSISDHLTYLAQQMGGDGCLRR